MPTCGSWWYGSPISYFFLRTIGRRRGPGGGGPPYLCGGELVFSLGAFIVVVAILHIVNNLAVPVTWGHAKSYNDLAGRPGRYGPDGGTGTMRFAFFLTEAFSACFTTTFP